MCDFFIVPPFLLKQSRKRYCPRSKTYKRIKIGVEELIFYNIGLRGGND